MVSRSSSEFVRMPILRPHARMLSSAAQPRRSSFAIQVDFSLAMRGDKDNPARKLFPFKRNPTITLIVAVTHGSADVHSVADDNQCKPCVKFHSYTVTTHPSLQNTRGLGNCAAIRRFCRRAT